MRKIFILTFFNLIILISNGNNDNYKKRYLEDEDSDFRDLSIHLDFCHFDEAFPSEFGDTKEFFHNSMNKSKTMLEEILLISPETGGGGLEYDESYKADMGISCWNIDKYKDDDYLSVETCNIYIFFKFDELNNVDMYSKISFTYSAKMPIIGLVTINKNIDRSKLNEDYLTFLFLQQFIKILGFHLPFETYQAEFEGPIEAVVEEELDDEGRTLYLDVDRLKVHEVWISEEKAEKVINYAKEYFACDKIEKIELELDDYNNVYWPSKIFSADIMTKFNSYQEKFISGFTLALLENTGYLRVKEGNAYTSGLMISGKNQGCECFFSGNCKIESDDDDDKLSTGAIIGIVFGCVGFILIVLGIIYYILKKGKKDNQITQLNNEEKISEEKVEGDNIYNNNNQHEDEIQIEDIDKQNQVNIHSKAKRKISNK